METNKALSGVWIFGDYRNYFQNRGTLQLIAKGKDLAEKLDKELTVLVLGYQAQQYVMEYAAHGADIILVADHPDLKDYRVETYTTLVASWQ